MNLDAREIELKLRCEPSQEPEILALCGAGALPSARRLTSIYYDTPRRALRRAGFVLRLRREGRRWTQTVKSTAWADGRPGRGEWEIGVRKGSLDMAAIRATPAGLALPRGARLEALFEIAVQRRTLEVREGGGVIEVSFDVGEAKAVGRAQGFCELELELKAGPPEALFALAQRLSEAFALTLSFTTKADRGFGVMAARSARAAHFAPPHLHPKTPTADAFRAIAMAALAQLGSNALRVGAHPGAESIHQLRVAVRRLRGTLSTFKPVIDDSQVEAIKIELKWLGRELDEARNLDVFITGALRRAKGDAPMPRPLAAFGRRLRAARKAAYARARDAAAGARFRTLLLDAVQWVEVGPWTRARGAAAKLRKAPAGDLAAKALARPRRRIRKDGADLAGISRHRRHRVRIQAKILRYACEAFAPLIEDHPKRAAVFIDGLKDLQEVLGDINDIVCGETLIEEMATPELAQGLIQSERARETRLIAAAQDALDTFAEARRFWRQ